MPSWVIQLLNLRHFSDARQRWPYCSDGLAQYFCQARVISCGLAVEPCCYKVIDQRCAGEEQLRVEFVPGVSAKLAVENELSTSVALSKGVNGVDLSPRLGQ